MNYSRAMIFLQVNGGHEERKKAESMCYDVFGNRLENLIIIKWERKYLDRNERFTEGYGSLEWRKKCNG